MQTALATLSEAGEIYLAAEAVRCGYEESSIELKRIGTPRGMWLTNTFLTIELVHVDSGDLDGTVSTVDLVDVNQERCRSLQVSGIFESACVYPADAVHLI